MILELNWVEMGRYELRFGANEADRLQEAYEAPPVLHNPFKENITNKYKTTNKLIFQLTFTSTCILIII